MENQVLIALKNNKLLKNILFDDLELSRIKGNLRTLSEGEILFREGEESNTIYLVVSGEINLLKKRVGSRAQSYIFSDHDFFGCDEFIGGEKRKSTTVALRDSYIIALSRNEIEMLIEQNDEILKNIYNGVTEREEPEVEIPKEKIESIDFKSNTSKEKKTLTAETTSPVDSLIPVEEPQPTTPVEDEIIIPESSIDEDFKVEEENIAQPDQISEPERIEETGQPISEHEDTKEISPEYIEDEVNIVEDEIPVETKESSKVSDDFHFSERFGIDDEFKVPDDGNIPSPEGTIETEQFIKSLEDYEQSFKDFSEESTHEEKISPEKIMADELDLNKFEEKESYDEINIEQLSADEVEVHSFESDEKTGEAMGDMTVEGEKNEIHESSLQPADENPTEEIEEKKNEIHQPVSSKFSNPSVEYLEKINRAAQLLNSNIKIDELLQNIVKVACDLADADRGTLYLVEKQKDELWSKIAIGSEFKEIKLKIGEGIAGWVAKSGEVINLEKVEDDPRFNRSFDKSSGYITKCMICFPIRNRNNEIVGVLQLLNSKHGKFTKIDEELLEALSIHAAIALQNADLVEKLLSSERVSSLGKMANFLLQDIKKPVMVSKRYAEHLKSKELHDDASKVVDMLLEQLNHIADLVQSTSSYSEGQIVLRSILKSLNETFDDCIKRLDSYVRSRNCRIIKEYDKNVNIKVAEKQFFQAIQHIVKNACDAMPEGGDINITTKIIEDHVKLSIKDNGLGIPETLHEKIFEPFMSHGKKEGTGLGLSITRKIIEEHGGSIQVQSEIGEGANFIITLPIVFSV